MNDQPLKIYFQTDLVPLVFKGEKACSLLNGQLTNDIKNLKTGETNYNLLLTIKGKVVADMHVLRNEDDFEVWVPRIFVEKVLDHFKRLAPLSKVEIIRPPGDGKNPPRSPFSKGGCLESERIENGIPKVGVDVTEENLPQEGKLDHALSFTKGCYLGQEIIARLHYKGHVNKILELLVIEGKEVPEPGTLIMKDEQIVGKVTSSTFSTKY